MTVERLDRFPVITENMPDAPNAVCEALRDVTRDGPRRRDSPRPGIYQEFERDQEALVSIWANEPTLRVMQANAPRRAKFGFVRAGSLALRNDMAPGTIRRDDP